MPDVIYYTGRRPDGRHALRVGIIPGSYGYKPIFDSDTCIKLFTLFSITPDNVETLRLDLGYQNNCIWFEGRQVIMLELEPHQGGVGGCPKCHHPGSFVRTALCCPTHGVFGGF